MLNKNDFHETLISSRQLLLQSRGENGFWTGRLSSSALSTATAIVALSIFTREVKGKINKRLANECNNSISLGIKWLEDNQNSDGGYGDTVQSISNFSTTSLVWATLGDAGCDTSQINQNKINSWLMSSVGSLDPKKLSKAVLKRYGNDFTFSVPILTLLALTGKLGKETSIWRQVPQLPFELAAVNHQLLKWLNLPVVSYALPALIAIGLVRHHFAPSRNPIIRLGRRMILRRILRKLEMIQPNSGGYLEAVPLTSFVVMSLAAANYVDHPVVIRGIRFILKLARGDGSWPIDTDLAIWNTTLTINAFKSSITASNLLNQQEQQSLRKWILENQSSARHFYSYADPGGWGWTDKPGSVPDADDTAGALLSLQNLGVIDKDVLEAVLNGIKWLISIQNRDGGIPTFCRGWGRMPFDKSTPDVTAHVLLAWNKWFDSYDKRDRPILKEAINHSVKYIKRSQHEDGSWPALWFGNEFSKDEVNLTYGTSRVLLALNSIKNTSLLKYKERGVCWLLESQNLDGGWGGQKGVSSSVEETSLAVHALADFIIFEKDLSNIDGNKKDLLHQAALRGTEWIIKTTKRGSLFKPTPIGLYFSKLWYFESLYPIIFTVGALNRLNVMLSTEKESSV